MQIFSGSPLSRYKQTDNALLAKFYFVYYFISLIFILLVLFVRLLLDKGKLPKMCTLCSNFFFLSILFNLSWQFNFFLFFSERQQWTLFQIFWVNYCNRQEMDRILPNIMSEILHSQLRELQQRKGFCLWLCLCSLLITEWTRKGFCLKYQLWLVLHTQLSEAE